MEPEPKTKRTTICAAVVLALGVLWAVLATFLDDQFGRTIVVGIAIFHGLTALSTLRRMILSDMLLYIIIALYSVSSMFIVFMTVLGTATKPIDEPMFDPNSIEVQLSMFGVVLGAFSVVTAGVFAFRYVRETFEESV